MTRAARWLDLPIRHPRIVLAISACITLALALGVGRVEVDASIESMIVEGDPERASFERMKELFGSDEVIAIALPFDDALTPEALDVQQRIVRRLEGLREVADVDALVATDDIRGRDDLLEVEPLVPGDAADLSPTQTAEIRDRVERNRLWTGFLISGDRRTAALQVHLVDPSRTDVDRGATMAAIEEIVEEERGDGPYYFAGHPFMKTEIARTMQRDLSAFLPVTLAVMAVFLVLCVGSLRVALVMLAGVLLPVLWMIGAMGWIGQPITALSNTAPTILLALGTAYLMHLAASYQRAAVTGGDRRAVVRRALERVRRPTIVAGLTTAIGFAFIALSHVPLVRGFGIDLAVGILAVVVFACLSVPAALALLPPTPGRGVLANERRLGILLFGVSRLVASRARAILVASLVLVVLGALASTRLEVDSSGPNAFDEASRFRRSSEFYRAHFSGDVIENVYLSAPEEGFTEPDRLRRMLAFQEAAERLPEIDKTISIANYITLMNRAIHGDDPAQERIPDSSDAVAQYLLLYASSGEPDEFEDLVDVFHAEARIVLKATVLSSRESAALRAKLEALLREYLPGESRPDSVLSTEILLSKAADTLSVEQVRSLVGALVMILLVVALAFRSVRAGVLLGLPNGLPIVLNFGVMALVGITLRDVTSVIAVTALGIAVDSTVHLLEAIRVSEAEHRSRRAAVLEALMATGRPVVVTSLVIIAGFSVLALSDFRVISDFGGLTALAILAALLGDLLVLPAQLLIGRNAAVARADEGDPLLVAVGGVVFPAFAVSRRGAELGLRPLGAPRGWRERSCGEVELRGVARRRVRGRVRGIDPSAGTLRVTLDPSAARGAEPAPGSVGAAQGLRELFARPRRKEMELGGFRFRHADSLEERQVAYRLRHRVFVEEGFIHPDDHPGGSLRDAFDETAVQIIAYDAEGRPAGTARVVLPSPLGFHTERLFDFAPPEVPRERIGEVGRLAIAPEHRGGSRVPLLGLIKMIYDALRENGVTHAFAFMPPELVASLFALGCVSRPLLEERPHADTIERRRPMQGYFERHRAEAVFFCLDDIDRALGLPPQESGEPRADLEPGSDLGGED